VIHRFGTHVRVTMDSDSGCVRPRRWNARRFAANVLPLLACAAILDALAWWVSNLWLAGGGIR
jgi:hypothetical protein